MVKNTFKLVFIYAIILGIAGALASGFINMGLIAFSLIDEMAINFDSANGSFARQNNYIMITIYKIIASLLALLPLVLLIKVSTGALILKPMSLLAFTARTGVNTVNRTSRGLVNATRNGIGNSMNAIRGIAKGDPMSMYRSARYAEMALGRNNKLTNLLRRGGDISDFSQNLAGNRGEAKPDTDKEKKSDGVMSKINEATKPKDNKQIARNMSDREARARALKDMRKSQSDHIKSLKNQRRNAFKQEDKDALTKEINAAQRELDNMRDASMVNRLSFIPGVDASEFNGFIEEYDKNHEHLEIGSLANRIPGGIRNASNAVSNTINQVLNDTGLPQVKPTKAEGERALFFAAHSNALPVTKQVADAEIAKRAQTIGNPATRMAGLNEGSVKEEDREEDILRIARDGRGIPSEVLAAAQILGSFTAIYGGHLNPAYRFDSNATRGQIERAHLDAAQGYADGMDPGVAQEKINEDIRRIQKEARERSSLFTLDYNEFSHFAKESGVHNIGFKDADSDMIGQLGNAYVYEDGEGNKAIRFSKMQVRESKNDTDSVTTLKNVDVLLDQESQQKVKDNGLSNEEIVRGLAEGTLSASSTTATGSDGQEESIPTESISLVEQIRKEVELKKETEKEIKEYRQGANEQVTPNNVNEQATSNNANEQASPNNVNEQASPNNANEQTLPVTASTQQTVASAPQQVIQPGEKRVIQGSPVSNTNTTVQEINNIAGGQVATVSDNGNIQFSLNNEQIERLARTMRAGGQSTREAKGSEDTANFINNILDSLIPGSSSGGGSTVNQTNNSNNTNNTSNYRAGDSVNIVVNPSTGQQTYTRSSRGEGSTAAPSVSVSGIEKDLYSARQNLNSRMVNEQLERADEQIGGEERGNRLNGPRE